MKKTKECPKCKLMITVDNFEWHLKNGYNDYFIDEVEKESYEDSDDPDNTDFLQKNIDATRLYAHAYREEGHYGSHSGHDDYGDESEA